MTREELCVKIGEAMKAIDFKGSYLEHSQYGSGHINDTFLLRFQGEQGSVTQYILQRVNHEAFQNPEQLMENVFAVTKFLRNKIEENHGDVNRETINIIPTKAGHSYFQDSIGCYWRGYQFIDNSICYDTVKDPEDFYQSAVAFGNFQYQLADYPAKTLYETIPDFHNTPVRLERLKKAIEKDPLGRAKEVSREIEFALEREEFTHVLMDSYAKGRLPLKVTHNDTKLNNVLFDRDSKKALCVIDLDTVMPGFSVNDFGDSIRFGASTGAEDETDLSKVNLDLNLYRLYTKGFLEGCRGSLTDSELEMLPVGAKMMTLECGIRFLTDYLEGDCYFKIHREKHNLDRCRTQFKLVADMERNWQAMKEAGRSYSKM